MLLDLATEAEELHSVGTEELVAGIQFFGGQPFITQGESEGMLVGGLDGLFLAVGTGDGDEAEVVGGVMEQGDGGLEREFAGFLVHGEDEVVFLDVLDGFRLADEFWA